MIQTICERIANTYGRPNDLHLYVQSAVVPIPAQDLTKIVYELVDNAFKFSKPQAPVQINAAVEGGQYVLVVSDQGRGMAPEQIARIDAYVQFERAKYEQQGSGLGLAIVRRLVELVNGTFGIESVVEHGMTARVALLL